MNGSKIFCLILLMVNFACKEKPSQQVESSIDPIVQLTDQIKKSPRVDTLYMQRAILYAGKEAYDLAIQDVLNAIEIDSNKIVYHHNLSDLYIANINSKDALRTLERIVERYPEDIPSLLKLSELQLILKKHTDAIATIDRAFIRDKQNPKAYYLIGNILLDKGDTIKAINSFQQAVDFNPDLKAGWRQLGDLFVAIRKPIAIKYYETLISLDTNDIQSYFAHAYALQKFGKIKESIAAHKDICIKNPQFGPAFYNLGILYNKLDSLPQALDNFDIAVRIEPADAAFITSRAKVHLKLKNRTLAKQDLEQALRIDPDFADAKSELEKLK